MTMLLLFTEQRQLESLLATFSDHSFFIQFLFSFRLFIFLLFLLLFFIFFSYILAPVFGQHWNNAVASFTLFG